METTSLDTYEGQVDRLNQEYIVRVGAQLDARLRPQGGPIAVAYTPGNHSQYDLLFVPARGILQLSDTTVPVGLGLKKPPTSPPERWCVVAQVNCGAYDWVYPINLTPGADHFASYLLEKITDRNVADASALTALFRAICGRPIA